MTAMADVNVQVYDDLVRRLAAAVRSATLYSPAHPLVQRGVVALAGLCTSIAQKTDSIVIDTSYRDLSMNIGSTDQGLGTITYNANNTSLNEHFYDLLGGGAGAATSYFRAIVKFSDHQLIFTTTFTDNSGNSAFFTSSLPQGPVLEHGV